MKLWILLISLIALPLSAQAEGYGFRTPSANIYCNGSVEAGNITCTIVERSTGPAQPRPASCTGYWGHTFSLQRSGPAYLECSGFAPRKSRYTNVAGYGQTANFGAISCRSESTGLTCSNPQGHGFFLSRRSQKAY